VAGRGYSREKGRFIWLYWEHLPNTIQITLARKQRKDGMKEEHRDFIVDFSPLEL